jgi:hypothetical protein
VASLAVTVDGQTIQVPFNITDAGPLRLVVGSSKGSVGLDEVDRQLGGKAPLVRNFDDGAIPGRWSDTAFLPSDNRPVIASIVADPVDVAAGRCDAQIRSWLKDAPKGRMVALCHEGDAKVRKGIYTQAQWVAAQERFLPIAAEMGMAPVAITTYQSTLDGTIGSYWSAKMRAVPGVVVGVDTYTPGVPSATVPKMVKNIADFADSIGRPWVVPEFGVGLANAPGTTDVEKDQARGVAVAAICTWCATQVFADPNRGCKGLCYWPSGNFVPGPATWAALRAEYPVGG